LRLQSTQGIPQNCTTLVATQFVSYKHHGRRQQKEYVSLLYLIGPIMRIYCRNCHAVLWGVNQHSAD